MSELNLLFLQQVSDLSDIPILVADNACNIHWKSPFLIGESYVVKTYITDRHKASNLPWVEVVDQKCALCGFYDNGYHYCMGPVLLREYTQSEMWSLEKTLGISFHAIEKMPCKTLRDMTAYLLCLYTAITGKTPDLADIRGGRELENFDTDSLSFFEEQYRMRNAESGRFHVNYEESNIFVAMVENGDLDQYNKYIRYLDDYAQDAAGTMAVSSYKQCEYMAISMIVVVGRAMISSGVNARKGLNMSDLAMQKIEKCQTEKEIIINLKQYLLACIMEVRKEHESKKTNAFVEQIKDYVLHNLNKKIVIGDLAKWLSYSPEHLSRVFHEQENMTIQQYILQERLKAAENMLKYTDHDIALISEYLQFSSQSHFTRMFKQRTGFTPKQYRLKFSKTETISNKC